VPVVAMPLSLVGTFFVMLAMGYSINLLTLLALVLAIGLVVDDAIIVVENVHRHISEEGHSAFDAAILAARELGGPILAMTVVLVAVYVPIGFQGGLTGALFTEFAFTLAGAVTVSGIVALTLSPMMCSRLFRGAGKASRLEAYLDRQFGRLHAAYSRVLASSLLTWGVQIAMGGLLLLAAVALFITAKKELAPPEDQGFVLYQALGQPNTTAAAMVDVTRQIQNISSTEPEYRGMFQLTGVPTVNQGFGGVRLAPWGERKRSAQQIQVDLQSRWRASPAPMSSPSSSRPCRARAACRCSSCSRPPSPSRTSTRWRRRCSPRRARAATSTSSTATSRSTSRNRRSPSTAT